MRVRLWRQSLERVREDLPRAIDVTTSLGAQLQAAETQLQERALELEVLRRKE
jgi:hypothetical protein